MPTQNKFRNELEITIGKFRTQQISYDELITQILTLHKEAILEMIPEEKGKLVGEYYSQTGEDRYNIGFDACRQLLLSKLG